MLDSKLVGRIALVMPLGIILLLSFKNMSFSLLKGDKYAYLLNLCYLESMFLL